jgi:hypothetical protein
MTVEIRKCSSGYRRTFDGTLLHVVYPRWRSFKGDAFLSPLLYGQGTPKVNRAGSVTSAVKDVSVAAMHTDG